MHVKHHSEKPVECIKFAGSEQTLAQRFGLYPRPDRLLTPNEWEAVHGVARQRQDCLNACAVCLEAFRSDTQVLLSCSHVFHAQCLDSFERHARVRACPLCRKQWYQKHIIRDAAEAYQHACAARIQAVVRGWLCRRHLSLDVMRHAPPQAAGLKRYWAAGRLSEAGHALTELVQQGQDNIEQLFGELDASLQASKQLFQLHSSALQTMTTAAAPAQCQQAAQSPVGMLTARHRQKLRTGSWGGKQGAHDSSGSWGKSLHQQPQPAGHWCSQDSSGGRQQATGRVKNLGPCANSSNSYNRTNTRKQLPVSITAGTADTAQTETAFLQQGQGHSRAGDTEQALLTHLVSKPAFKQGHGEDHWAEVISRACHRGETECAICLCPLARRQQEGAALLSCSHTFHMQCIVSFEQFEQGRGGKATCPVCRGSYSKMCFAISTGTFDEA